MLLLTRIIIDADQREEEASSSKVDQQEVRQEECDDDTDVDDMSEEAKEEVRDIPVETNSDNIMVCKSQCCNSDRREPNQPTSTSILNAMKRVQGEGQLRRGRVVQTNWFNLYPWLTLCETKNKLFCFYCFNAVQRKLLTFSKKAEATFSKTGFCNWKRALQKLAKHQSSQEHPEAFMKMTNKVSISTIMNPAYQEQQQRRQKLLLKQLSSLQYLLRQGLAIRGHDDNKGNLLQLLSLRSEDNPEIKTWLCDGKYLLPVIINEQIKLMAEFVLRGLLSDIRSSRWFTIIADEATDISCGEQMCVAIRWADNNYEIHEDPIGLFQVPKTDAETLTSALKGCVDLLCFIN